MPPQSRIFTPGPAQQASWQRAFDLEEALRQQALDEAAAAAARRQLAETEARLADPLEAAQSAASVRQFEGRRGVTDETPPSTIRLSGLGPGHEAIPGQPAQASVVPGIRSFGTSPTPVETDVPPIHRAEQLMGAGIRPSVWARDPATGDVRLMSPQEAALTGAQQPDTAAMRNRQSVVDMSAKSVKAVQDLSQRVITKIGPAQRAEALQRGAQAVLGNDPDFRTYQDARTALAGNLAVLQQGSRPSDADIKAIWLPLVPDAFRDTEESARLKWEMIGTMSGIPLDSGQPLVQPADSGPAGDGWIDVGDGVRIRQR